MIKFKQIKIAHTDIIALGFFLELEVHSLITRDHLVTPQLSVLRTAHCHNYTVAHREKCVRLQM